MESTTTWGVVAAGVVMVAVAFGWPGAADALDIRVQGQAELSMEARAIGTRVQVSGHLYDDLKSPLPQRDIEFELRALGESDPTDTWTVSTDRKGRFETHRDVAPGQYELLGRFASTDHLEGTESRVGISAEPRPVALELDGPRVVRLGKETAAEVQVIAKVGGEGLSLPVRVLVGGQEAAAGELDNYGRASFDITGALEVGDNRVSVRTEGGEYREGARAQATVRLVDNLRVEGSFESVLARLERGARVSGRVVDDAGPVEGLEVEAVARRIDGDGAATTRGSGATEGKAGASQLIERSSTVETNAAGEFEVFFDRGDLSEGRWGARVKLIPQLGPPATTTVGELTIDHTFSRVVMYGAGGMALLALLVVVGREAWPMLRRRFEKWRRRRQRSREREQAFDEAETLEAVAMPEAASQEGWPSSTEIGGEIWDVWRDEPVDGAAVTARTESGETRETTTGAAGGFDFEDLDEGQWELSVRADGFVHATNEIPVPHEGRFSRSRFALIAVPLKIRRSYQALVEEAQGRDLWGELSPREIERTVVEVLEGPGAETGSEAAGRFVERLRSLLDGSLEELEEPAEYLEALTGVVEETYFSGRDYDEEVWHLARRLALKLRQMLKHKEDAR